ncbi:hypothetical protein Bca52824_034683 [Brassica carinata]|uniref:Uncharacterized protein n=1 Tax=Brassica carinata TaxID=52824 RepID=A0A8X7S2A0_BRACI|nr:hypothetical protein Bca52824_034683 [Brassica carinata]
MEKGYTFFLPVLHNQDSDSFGSAISFLVGLLYMRVFLKERLNNDEVCDHHQDDHASSDVTMLAEPVLNDTAIKTSVFNKKQSSLKDMIFLMKTSTIFVQALVVTSFSSFSDSGMQRVNVFLMQMAIVSISWAPWVPYLTTVLVPGTIIVMPLVCGIASRQVGPCEQGKVQECISRVKSFVKVAAPFVFSPLTAFYASPCLRYGHITLHEYCDSIV